MPEIYETELPGVGKKFTKELSNGDTISVVLHNIGKREIYFFEKGKEQVVISLTDEEARNIGTILSGAYFKPKVVEDLEVVLKELQIEWFEIKKKSKALNKTIAQLDIRKKTDATILAIIRGDESISNPSSAEIIKEGDTIVAIGKRESIIAFKKLVEWNNE